MRSTHDCVFRVSLLFFMLFYFLRVTVIVDLLALVLIFLNGLIRLWQDLMILLKFLLGMKLYRLIRSQSRNLVNFQLLQCRLQLFNLVISLIA